MKLSNKILFFFISVILLQVLLAVSVLSYFLLQQNQKEAIETSETEAKIVYDNFTDWKIYIWKKLVALKKDQVFQEFLEILRNSEANLKGALPPITQYISSALLFSGLDTVIVQFKEERIVKNLHPQAKELPHALVRSLHSTKNHPYIELKSFHNTLAIVGVIQCHVKGYPPVNLFLIKNIDTTFVEKLALNRESKNFIRVNDQFIAGSSQGLPAIHLTPSSQLHKNYQFINDLTLNNIRYHVVVQKIGKTVYNKPVFLTTMVSNELYYSKMYAMNRLIIYVFIVGAFVAIFLSLFLAKNITRPIGMLLHRIKTIENMEFDPILQCKAPYEIEELAQGFGEMMNKLKNYVRTIELLKDYGIQIINSIPMGIVTVNHQNEIVKVNQIFLDSLQFENDTVIGKSIQSLHFDLLDQQIIEQMEAVIAQKIPSYNCIKQYKTDEVYEISLYPIPESNVLFGCVILINNVSRKIEFEKKIIQAEKLASISLLSAGVAHEINNPLNSIIANVQPLLKQEENAQKLEALQWIEQETFRIGKIIRRLLDFASSHPENDVGASVNEVIEHIVQLVRSSLDNHVVIQTRLTPLRNKGTIGEDDLKQVLICLLTNSIDACQEKGVITIETCSHETQQIIEIIVRDNGEGIPEGRFSKIFDPFYTTKPTGKGTGLGLSIVYGILKQVNGNIEVESKVGEGTQFSMTFPWIETESL